MSENKSNGTTSPTRRSLTVTELGQTNVRKQEKTDHENTKLSLNNENQDNTLLRNDQTPSSTISRKSNLHPHESTRARSKTISNTTAIHDNDLSSTQSTGFHFLQSIKDLTHQELNRANPLGLLGKEVISATGTTHCPEPIPPKEIDELSVINTSSSSSSPSSSSPIRDNEPQQLHFPLTDEEKVQMHRRCTTVSNATDITLPPCPAEFLLMDDDQNIQPHLFSQPSPTTMTADFIPDTMTINVFEVFIYAWGVFAFFFDMVTDLVLAHAYYLEGAYWLFILTLMCVILPNLTLSLFSLVWYIDSSQLKVTTNDEVKCEYNTPRHTGQYQENDSIDKDHVDGPISRIKDLPLPPEQKPRKSTFRLSTTSVNILTWFIRIVILVLQLDLCLKYIRGLYYTWKGFQKRHHPKWARFYLTKQILIDADIALLRVFDCFMDSGSQVILQLYIMLRLGTSAMKFDTLFAKQCLSIISSLGSLAYALSGYSRCWRHMQLTHSPEGWPKHKPHPQLVSWWSTIVQWLWYLFLITPRVFALAMFAATFRSWFWMILVAHWFAMLFWILRFRTIFCISDQTKYNPREAIFEKCYNLVCSYIFIFCYMNLRKGNTRLHYISFYTICYIENISFSIIYAIHSSETNLLFKYSLVTFVCVGFWFAILFQFIYYRFLHPNDHVRLNTKHNVSSIVRIKNLPHFNRMKKSKSCEEMIDKNDLQNQNENSDVSEILSFKLNSNSINERWYNRFSKENRQKLISQQKAINRKVKLTKAQNHLNELTKPNENLSNSFSRKSTITTEKPIITLTSTSRGNLENNNVTITDSYISYTDNRSFRRQPFINLSRVTNQKSYSEMKQEDEDDFDQSSILYTSDKRTIHQNSKQSKTYNIHLIKNDKDDEMILTATKLSSLIISSVANDNKTYTDINQSSTTTTRC